MAVFNSLGSNYDFAFVSKATRISDSSEHSLALTKYLEERYQGEVTLVYKGREAIRLALRKLDLKDAVVGICGFTCFAVYDALIKEGYKVAYFDIDKSLNYSLETLKKVHAKNPKLKVILIQNTLGYPADIEKIVKYCSEKKIFIIEDLALCIGAKYDNSKEVGTVGDMTVLSFSQDKVVDGISGGALIVRNEKWKAKKEIEFLAISPKQQAKARMYPQLTWLIRKSYGFGIGKGAHFGFKKFKLLQGPMDDQEVDVIHSLPHWQAGLIYAGFEDLPTLSDHRRTIASIYAQTLDKSVLSKLICDKVMLSANLRFPIFLENRDSLFLHLKSLGIYITDTWFDAPISPKRYLSRTNYTNQCPNSEKIASLIVNLPTHKNISEKDARVLAKAINQWLK